MGFRFQTFLLVVFTFISFSTIYSQYKQEYNFKNIHISILEHRNVRSDAVRNVDIEVKSNNRLIDKNVNIEANYMDTSYVTDYDKDNNPEIILISRSHGSGASGKIYMYEFQNGNILVVKFPEVPAELNKFRQGHDTFEINSQNIIHRFPAYLPEDANCCATGGECVIKYNYTNDKIVKVSDEHIAPKGEQGFDVNIKSASDLPKMDAFSYTDCFVELFVDGNLVGRTRTIKDNDSPNFNETLSASVYKGGKIEFRLFDADMSGSRLIGKVLLAEPIDGSYPIQMEDNSGNVISRGELTVKFYK